ncbi:MAG: hypothetical protein ABIT83_14560 [Massilia sp.]
MKNKRSAQAKRRLASFVWAPGSGYDALALERIRAHFPRPSRPMGEAWFMNDERVMFDRLLGDLDVMTTRELQEPLREIASGTMSFGPFDEWTQWYHYLLGQLVPRSHERYDGYLLEYLVNGFISLYPSALDGEPYPGFRDDALLTLGRCMMDGVCWVGEGINLGVALHDGAARELPPSRWDRASGDLSAPLFFCLKYLPAASIPAWLRSVLDIPSAYWQAQLLVWLAGAHGILDGQLAWPTEWDLADRPDISWAWSHVLRGQLCLPTGELALRTPMLPEENRIETLRVLAQELTEERYLAWLDNIDHQPFLLQELEEIPSRFEQLYLSV